MHQQFADEYLRAPGELDGAPINFKPRNRARSKISAAVA
jgi:hypothetical protein